MARRAVPGPKGALTQGKSKKAGPVKLTGPALKYETLRPQFL